MDARLNQESSFENWHNQNANILNQIAPLTEKERQEMHLRKEKQSQGANLEGKTEMEKALYFARKNKKCVALAACAQAIAEVNIAEWKAKTESGGRQIFRQTTKIVQQMDYLEAKAKFWHLYLKDCFYPNPFLIDQNNKNQIDQLLKYFIQDPSCKLDLRKGIALCGGVGTGKTEIMRQFALFCEDNKIETSFKMKPMRDYIREVASKGLGIVSEYLINDYCFDDIAVSAPSVNHFGTQITPLDDLIQGRYDRFTKRNPRPTHFTINLNFNTSTQDDATRETISKIYDQRTIDRMQQMCNFVYLGGGSRRK